MTSWASDVVLTILGFIAGLLLAAAITFSVLSLQPDRCASSFYTPHGDQRFHGDVT